MTDLGCCVNDCKHNEENRCCRNGIEVGGCRATESCCTCCSSFEEGERGASNYSGAPNERLEIKCEADNCMYNENYNCTAGHVDVTHSSKGTHGQTECSTFKMK